MAHIFVWLYREFGLASLRQTGRDAWLIILARACRMFAYGTNALVLALFFAELKFSDYQIGLFMTLTLLGDVLLSLLLTLVADKVGRRRTLFIGSVLMVCSGATFALFENFWILLFAAVVGVVSATGGDFGPFRAIEESTLSHLTNPKTRSDVLAWYVTTAALGSSAGTEFCGRIIEYLHGNKGWTLADSYHAIFWIYCIMGAANIACTYLLSANCEATEVKDKDESEHAEALLNENGESSSRGDDGGDDEDADPIALSTPKPKPKSKWDSWTSRFSQISKPTRSVMYKLWFLLIIDSLADGMTPFSLTNYYIDEKFHLPKSTLGDITSAAYFLSSFSTIFAGPLSNRIGLINTMVFTHIPSSTAVLLFPLPHNLAWTIVLLLVRIGLNNMDQAPRAAFIAAVVKPEERTAVMGITSMLRTLAATTGPTVTGILAGNDRFWIAFVAAGALRLSYDIGLWAMFVNMKLYQNEEPAAQGVKLEEIRRRSSDEEEAER